MIITIDTEKDSAEKLRQTAHFLLRLAGDSTSPAPASPVEPLMADSQPETVDMMNIFGAASQEPSEPEKPDVSSDGFRVLPYE